MQNLKMVILKTFKWSSFGLRKAKKLVIVRSSFCNFSMNTKPGNTKGGCVQVPPVLAGLLLGLCQEGPPLTRLQTGLLTRGRQLLLQTGRLCSSWPQPHLSSQGQAALPYQGEDHLSGLPAEVRQELALAQC